MSDSKLSITLFFQGIVNNATPKKLNALANDLVTSLKAKLNHPGTGRLYRKSGNPAYSKPDASGKRTKMPSPPSAFHRASAPGEPPAPDTTRLRESATSVRSGLLKWRVGVSAPAAEILETELNRPYFTPTVESWRERAGKLLAEGSKS